MVFVVIGVVIGAMVIGLVAFVYLYRLQQRRETVTVLPFTPDSDQPAQSAETTLGDLEQYATSLLKGNPSTSTPLANLTRGAGAIELLDDVLFLVRLESGGEASHNLGFDVSSLIQDTVQQLSNRANEKGISLYFATSESLPELISSDPGKLTRILQGLVGPCIEHTESGRVLIEAEFSSDISMLTLDITHPGSLESEELFDPEISSNDLPSTHRLRLAVCHCVTIVLGGGLSVYVSDGDTIFSLDISASEIRPRQFVLPDGKTLDELITSEQSARQLSDERLQALQHAEQQAAKEVERRTQLESELSTEIGRLTNEL